MKKIALIMGILLVASVLAACQRVYDRDGNGSDVDVTVNNNTTRTDRTTDRTVVNNTTTRNNGNSTNIAGDVISITGDIDIDEIDQINNDIDNDSVGNNTGNSSMNSSR